MYTIPPFPTFSLGRTLHGGHVSRFPGHLPSEDAMLVERIHKRLMADSSYHPENLEQLVCRAVQECYDALKNIHGRNGPLYHEVLESDLPERALMIAIDCKWLPETARINAPEWIGWVKELLAGRFSRVGLEDSRKRDPYRFNPFPVDRSTSRPIPERVEPTTSATTPSVARRTKPGPRTDLETARAVAEVVNKIANGEPWKNKLDEICDELDERKVRCPKPWRTRDVRNWQDAAATEKELAKKAISHHLKNATKS